jgi:hypothetical protein
MGSGFAGGGGEPVAGGRTPYIMMAGLGVNGTAGVKSTAGLTTDWPEILGGEGGPVAIDPGNSANWYVNNQAGVSIYLVLAIKMPARRPFGDQPGRERRGCGRGWIDHDHAGAVSGGPAGPDAIADRDLPGVARAGRWRGLERGNVISPILDGTSGNSYCSGDALIRSMAAMALPVSTALPRAGKWSMWACMAQANGGAPLSRAM